MNKKHFLRGLALTLFALVSPTLWAYDFEVDGIYYNITSEEDLTVEVTSNSSSLYEGAITIPSTVYNSNNGKTYAVTSIGNRAFLNCSELNTVSIPNGVISIGDLAFLNCNTLESVIIPNSVTTIRFGAFECCRGLTSVTIPSSVITIGDSSFSDCSGLTSLEIPNSVKVIGYYAFHNCSGLTSVEIPNSVTTFGYAAFSGCTGLKSVEILEGVTVIGGSAFSLCKSLTSVTIPSSVITIGDWAFQNCSSLTSVTIPENVTSIKDGVFYGCSSLASITIPSGVTNIGINSFAKCSSLTELNIPNSVESIGTAAFSGCRSLTSITVEEGGVYDSRNNCNAIIFGDELVAGCVNTVIPSTVTSIGESAFNGSGLTSITIPGSITNIGSFAFGYCEGLETVTIPSSVASLGDQAFFECTGLTSIICEGATPPTAQSLTFGYVDKSIPVYVPNVALAAYRNADYWKEFTNIQMTDITFADANVKSLCVANWDTNGDGELSVVEAAAVTSIGTVFKGNTKITTFEEFSYFLGLTAIDNSAFEDCSELTSVTIPSSVASLGDQAFFGCTGLTSIICEGATPPTAQSSTFGYVDKSILVYVHWIALATYQAADYWKEFSNFQAIDPVITFADSNVKSLCVANWDTDGDGELSEVEAAAVTSIGTVFKGNTKIATFEELAYFTGLTSIGANAFQNCTALTTITVPDNVKSIGNYAFSKCKKLTTVSMPDNVSTIGTYAFQNCTALTEFTIPSGVTAISQRMFEGCTALKTVDIPNSVTTIGMFSFLNCSSLKSVIIPNSVTTIEKNVFESSGMTTLTIPNSVTTLGNSIFKNCTSVTTVICECVTPPTITYGTSIEPIPTSAVVKVPVTSLYAYQNDANWNTYTNGNMQGVLFEPYMRNVSYDWGTVVLPYTTESTEDVQLYSLKSADLTEGILRLTPENTIPANTPCIFKRLDSEATTVTFPIVEQGSTAQPTVSAVTAVDGWTFKGTYYDRTLTPSATPSVYYIAEDQFWFANEAFSVAAFRGWFETAAPANARFFRIQIDEEITGIEEIEQTDGKAEAVYDLMGRRLPAQKRNTINIKNGKITLVK